MRNPVVREQVHDESLEDEATHATDEARMVLPGIQAILGFQLIAVFNQRFTELTGDRQLIHLVAFLLVALATGLLMAPAAFHRQTERGRITRRFVDLASTLLTLSLMPLAMGIAIDTYLIVWLVTREDVPALACGGGLLLGLLALWFGLPQFAKRSDRMGARTSSPPPIERTLGHAPVPARSRRGRDCEPAHQRQDSRRPEAD